MVVSDYTGCRDAQVRFMLRECRLTISGFEVYCEPTGGRNEKENTQEAQTEAKTEAKIEAEEEAKSEGQGEVHLEAHAIQRHPEITVPVGPASRVV